jgi:hypothetical protein
MKAERDNDMIVVEIPHTLPVRAYFITARRMIYLARTTTNYCYCTKKITDVLADHDTDEPVPLVLLPLVLQIAENGIIGNVNGEYCRPSDMPTELTWAIEALYHDNHATFIFDSAGEALAHEFIGHGRVEAREAVDKLLGEK